MLFEVVLSAIRNPFCHQMRLMIYLRMLSLVCCCKKENTEVDHLASSSEQRSETHFLPIDLPQNHLSVSCKCLTGLRGSELPCSSQEGDPYDHSEETFRVVFFCFQNQNQNQNHIYAKYVHTNKELPPGFLDAE